VETVDANGRSAGTAPGGTALGSPEWLREELERFISEERVLHRPIDLIAFACDASFYRLIPKAVVLASTKDEIKDLFRYSRRRNIPLVFRASGTSLSGQSITDGILVEIKRYWNSVKVEEGGKKVRVKPGAIGNHVNAILRPYGAKIGPDPASIHACAMGGILSNNSSGMCCGVLQNSYHTLDSLTFVLPSGTMIDTGDPDADKTFREEESELSEALLGLKREIEADEDLARRIRSKYKMKNTNGYALNAFIDFERPVDIFSHLLIGSEGTLAFIAEAVLNTVPDLPHKYTGLLLFHDLHAAGAAIAPLREAGAKALEIMDRPSLRAIEGEPGILASVKTLPDTAAAILAEFQCAEESEVPGIKAAAEGVARKVQLLEPAEFTEDPEEQAKLWAAREGLLPTIAAIRKSGTSVIHEDLVFPIEHLADAILDLSALFEKHGYHDGVIYGHAKDGNLHFAIYQSFRDRAGVEQYADFMGDVVDLVVKKYDGALKAEHGTGRNMAPFLETEWGPEAVAIMRRLKALVDPDGLLNPGVILNPSPTAHVDNLKSEPTIEEEADKCMECGYCEHVCPSRELSLTPRQRIVVRREMVQQEQQGGTTALLQALEADYPYLGNHTCAGDGMCQTQCPVHIDTGALIKRFRHRSHSHRAEAVARGIANRYATAEPLARTSLRMGHLVQATLGSGAMIGLTEVLRKTVGNELFPLWSKDMPKPAPGRLPKAERDGAQAVYFPACINRIFGHSPGERSGTTLPEAFLAITRRAGVPVYVPEDVAGICCGTPWHSKGYVDGNDLIANRSIERCWEWSEGGRLPIIVDASSCTYGFRTCRGDLTPENRARFDRLEFLDSVEFAHDELIPKLQVDHKLPSVAVHSTCSVVKMGVSAKLANIGKALGNRVVVPLDSGCCGFAGDRGFLWPELTASATRHEAQDLAGNNCAAYVSSNRTCEVGMSRATKKVYRSYIYPLEEATRSMDTQA